MQKYVKFWRKNWEKVEKTIHRVNAVAPPRSSPSLPPHTCARARTHTHTHTHTAKQVLFVVVNASYCSLHYSPPHRVVRLTVESGLASLPFWHDRASLHFSSLRQQDERSGVTNKKHTCTHAVGFFSSHTLSDNKDVSKIWSFVSSVATASHVAMRQIVSV